MRHRQEEIHNKGFSLGNPRSYEDFGKMRVGLKEIDDAIFNLNPYKKVTRIPTDKKDILKALHDHNYEQLRKVSNLFYETSGIYSRLCKYGAYLYRYDWYLIPYLEKNERSSQSKVLKSFSNILTYLDNSNIQMVCGKIALNVIRDGCYYGYVVKGKNSFSIQDLPIEYCRSRYSLGDVPVVEFNMRYFDNEFADSNYRMRVLDMFPEDFKKGYILYKQGKLPVDYQGDTNGWYMLDTNYAVKFNCCGSDFPMLANAIPAIIDLIEAQNLDRQKMMQKLLKIIIQKLPIDRNGDLIFDVDEAADIHNNTVAMLHNAIGVDVMTTFADVEVADMADKNTTTSKDDLEKVERTVYNEFGVSRNLFNSDGNLALTNSILDDEASIRNLVLQFQNFLNRIIEDLNKDTRNCHFSLKMLETTIYNYKDMSKVYKEQTQMGYSKMLPQIALGHSQSEILATANFENEILHLADIMIPPMLSSTMSTKTLGKNDEIDTSKNQISIEDNEGGRPEKPDNEKSDKTLANRESM